MGLAFKEVREVKNYYEILDVPVESTQEEINEAYNRSKNAYSGESIALYSLMTVDECQAILEMVEEAYSILGEPSKRAGYNKARGFDTKTLFHKAPEGQVKKLPDLKKNKQLSTVKVESFSTVHREAEVSKIAAVNRFSLKYTLDTKIEEEIESCQDFTGEFLRRIREYKGVDIHHMSDITKVSKTYIRNIEDEDSENLPASVYVRGFVYQYAKTLKLNPDYVANSYISRLKKKK